MAMFALGIALVGVRIIIDFACQLVPHTYYLVNNTLYVHREMS